MVKRKQGKSLIYRMLIINFKMSLQIKIILFHHICKVLDKYFKPAFDYYILTAILLASNIVVIILFFSPSKLGHLNIDNIKQILKILLLSEFFSFKFQLRRVNFLNNNFHISELHLQDNQLVDITGAVGHLSCLRVLMLQNNQLTKLEKVVREFQKMLTLHTLSKDYHRSYCLFFPVFSKGQILVGMLYFNRNKFTAQTYWYIKLFISNLILFMNHVVSYLFIHILNTI